MCSAQTTMTLTYDEWVNLVDEPTEKRSTPSSTQSAPIEAPATELEHDPDTARRTPKAAMKPPVAEQVDDPEPTPELPRREDAQAPGPSHEETIDEQGDPDLDFNQLAVAAAAPTRPRALPGSASIDGPAVRSPRQHRARSRRLERPTTAVRLGVLVTLGTALDRVKAAAVLSVLVVVLLGTGLIAKQQLDQTTTSEAASIRSAHLPVSDTALPTTAKLTHHVRAASTSITADEAKAAQARAAAQANARARAAARKARARRALRARAARARRRHQAAARVHHAPQSPPASASTTSTYTPPSSGYGASSSASSGAAEPSTPPSQTPSSRGTAPAQHPYGVGGLLSVGSSPSG